MAQKWYDIVIMTVEAAAEPPARIEEQVLAALGYSERQLDAPVGGAAPGITGRNFLEGYGASPMRTETEDTLYGFMAMDPADPDYPAMRTYVATFLTAYLGEPQPAEQQPAPQATS